MKKIITLLLVATMLCTMAFSVSADVTKGINVHFVEDENGLVTATVSAVGASNLTNLILGITYDKTAVTLLQNDKATEATTISWDSVVDAKSLGTLGKKDLSWTNGSKTLKFITGAADQGQTLDATNSVDMYSFYFKKVDGATISDSTFTSYYNAMGGQTYYEDGGSKYKFNVAGTIALTVTPYVDDTPTTVDKWETSAAPEGWTAPAALEGEVRRVAVFGKNATAKALGENEYGVTFGANTYYGVATTDAVNAWAIVLVDTTGDDIKAGHEYTGTAFVGETKWSVTVSAN